MPSLRPVVAAVLVHCAIAFALPLAAEVKLQPIAHRIVDGTPVWVSEKTAFGPDGELRRDLFSDAARAFLEEVRTANASECVSFAGASSLDIHAPSDSIDALARYSETIIAGRVVAAEQGFYRGEPGTVFTIRVSHRPKGTTAESSDPVHLFIGAARIDTGRGLICARTRRNAVHPAVGDDILFFAYGEPIDIENRILAVDPQRHILVQSDRGIRLPRALQNDSAPRTLDEAIRRAALAIGEDNERRVR
jgi:hypothetical protein